MLLMRIASLYGDLCNGFVAMEDQLHSLLQSNGINISENRVIKHLFKPFLKLEFISAAQLGELGQGGAHAFS